MPINQYEIEAEYMVTSIRTKSFIIEAETEEEALDMFDQWGIADDEGYEDEQEVEEDYQHVVNINLLDEDIYNENDEEPVEEKEKDYTKQ